MSHEISLDAALRAPVAVKLPERTAAHLELDWLWHMAAFAETDESRALWRGRYESARNQRAAR